jgi:hypothetical protein
MVQQREQTLRTFAFERENGFTKGLSHVITRLALKASKSSSPCISGFGRNAKRSLSVLVVP